MICVNVVKDGFCIVCFFGVWDNVLVVKIKCLGIEVEVFGGMVC